MCSEGGKPGYEAQPSASSGGPRVSVTLISFFYFLQVSIGADPKCLSRTRIRNTELTKNLNIFTQKIVAKLSGPVFFHPGSMGQKKHWISDSGSVTLILTTYIYCKKTLEYPLEIVRKQRQDDLIMDITMYQCWESKTFWCGSGSKSPDPFLWLMDSTSFVSDIKEVKKKQFSYFFLITYPQARYLQS